MFSFSNNFLSDEKGVEGAKIIKFTPMFNNKIKGQNNFAILNVTKYSIHNKVRNLF